MPHVRERQPEPDEPGAPVPGGSTSDVPAPGLADHAGDTPRTPRRVDASEAPPGGISGDDGPLDGDDPA